MEGIAMTQNEIQEAILQVCKVSGNDSDFNVLGFYTLCDRLVELGAAAERESGRLRRGDILRCIETNELCTVWATSTTGKTLVKWKENDFGQYTAEQIGDLFWVEPKPEPNIVQDAVVYGTGITKDGKRIDPASIYKGREWQGLTDDEIKDILDCGRPNLVNIKKAEQKLKEKNT